jgi:hypothetical protein
MTIPKKIKVGFQNRSDTYTGKLAYVIYYDEKGKLRKEGSWASWRSKEIDPKEFENVPISGFVLNKKVGGYKSDWNYRQAMVRVYDPRDFEFEITLGNLLYLLEECSSIKGKGLEGEFVYAWDGKDLVLLPASAQEYKSSQKFTDYKSLKINKKDMKEGLVYIMKDMKNVLYLGKHETFEYDWKTQEHASEGFKHIFEYVEKEESKYAGDHNYLFLDNFNKIALKVSDEISTEFAESYDKLKKSIYRNKCHKIVVKETEEKFNKKYSHWQYGYGIIKDSTGNLIKVSVEQQYNRNHYDHEKELYKIIKHKDISIQDNKIVTVDYDRYGTSLLKECPTISSNLTKESVESLECYKIVLENDFGNTIEVNI